MMCRDDGNVRRPVDTGRRRWSEGRRRAEQPRKRAADGGQRDRARSADAAALNAARVAERVKRREGTGANGVVCRERRPSAKAGAAHGGAHFAPTRCMTETRAFSRRRACAGWGWGPQRVPRSPSAPGARRGRSARAKEHRARMREHLSCRLAGRAADARQGRCKMHWPAAPGAASRFGWLGAVRAEWAWQGLVPGARAAVQRPGSEALARARG